MNIHQNFEYNGCRFVCSVVHLNNISFEPHVLYERGLPGVESMALAQDGAPYASQPEAMRHAEQQAIRWVHDRTGHGQGES